jgi:hypothetical protein
VGYLALTDYLGFTDCPDCPVLIALTGFPELMLILALTDYLVVIVLKLIMRSLSLLSLGYLLMLRHSLILQMIHYQKLM